MKREYHCKKFCVSYMQGADKMQDVENFVNEVNKEAGIYVKVTWLPGDAYVDAIVEWTQELEDEVKDKRYGK